MDYLTKKQIFNYDFILLLLYSLLQGIYKILGNHLFSLLAVPIIMYFFFKRRNTVLKIYRIDTFFILFIFYIFAQSLLYFIIPTNGINRIAILMGWFLQIIPMAGFFISRKLNFEKFCIQIIYVVIIHSLIGILLYQPFNFVNQSLPVVSKLKDGFGFIRMTSVAGSIGFGNLLVLGFILAFYYKKIYLPLFTFCVFFSMQRSAWLSVVIVFLVNLLMIIKTGHYKKISINIIVYGVFILCLIFFVQIAINSSIGNYILLRLDSFDSASSERMGQWQRGIQNFSANPIGVGVGQAGQIAANIVDTSSPPVADGDFLRILSEYGISGVLLILTIMIFSLFLFIFKKLSNAEMCVLTIIICSAFQMTGSNITECFFNNFILWIFIGKMIYIFRSRFYNVNTET
jgi:hypothetical protein